MLSAISSDLKIKIMDERLKLKSDGGYMIKVYL